MFKPKTLVAACLTTVALSGALAAPSALAAKFDKKALDFPHVSGELLVTFKDAADTRRAMSLLGRSGAVKAEALDITPGITDADVAQHADRHEVA